MEIEDIIRLELEEENEIYNHFLNAVDELNEDLIISIISKNHIRRHYSTIEGNTLLHIIAERGTVKTATKLCELGLDVNYQNRFGKTPIFYAFKHSKEMVKLLLDHGATLDTKCRHNISALHEALFSGSEEIVKLVLNKIFADKQDENNAHPFKVQTTVETVKALLHHKSDLHLQVKDYPLLIFFAARTGNKEVFKLTLNDCRTYLNSVKGRHQEHPSEEKEANVVRSPEELNFQGYYNRTALHYAVKKQLPDVIRFLLEAGADVNCKTDYGFTPLHYAACLANEDVCKILLNFGAEVNPTLVLSPLYLVCGSSRAPNVLNSSDGYYCQKLHGTYKFPFMEYYRFYATFNLPLIKLLLQNEANPDIPNHVGRTPLLEACSEGCLDVMKLLLDFNANIQARDEKGYSALHYATLSNNIEVVDFLLEKGIDIEVKNNEGCTPFMFAVENEDETTLEMIEYLADVGANINARNVYSVTALHFASYFYLSRRIQCLLALGANYKLEFDSAKSLSNYNVLKTQWIENYIIAFNAIKEDTLGDYIFSYVRNEFENQDNCKSNKINAIHGHFRRCKLELKRMKSTKIVDNSRYSFHDFLTSNIYFAFKIIQDVEARKAFTHDYKYRTDFPCYELLLEDRYERVATLEKDVVKMVDFIKNFEKKCDLPSRAVDKILSFFHVNDFRKFGRFSSRRQH